MRSHNCVFYSNGTKMTSNQKLVSPPPSYPSYPSPSTSSSTSPTTLSWASNCLRRFVISTLKTIVTDRSTLLFAGQIAVSLLSIVAIIMIKRTVPLTIALFIVAVASVLVFCSNQYEWYALMADMVVIAVSCVVFVVVEVACILGSSGRHWSYSDKTVLWSVPIWLPLPWVITACFVLGASNYAKREAPRLFQKVVSTSCFHLLSSNLHQPPPKMNKYELGDEPGTHMESADQDGKTESYKKCHQ